MKKIDAEKIANAFVNDICIKLNITSPLTGCQLWVAELLLQLKLDYNTGLRPV